MKLLSFLLGIIIIFSVTFSPAFAQTISPTFDPDDIPTVQPEQGLNLTLSPTYISLTTDPGKEVSSQFRITNNNTFTEYLSVSVAKMEVGADGRPVLSDLEANDEFGDWISIPEQQFSVGGNQNKVVRFTISPPDEAALGYYYTLLISRISSPDQVNQPQAVVAGSAGITVLLDVRSPNAKRELQVANFSTDKLFYEYLPTTFKIRVKNTGNVHLIPFGDIFIDSLFNKNVSKSLLTNPGRGNVLPQSEREFVAIWDDSFAVRKAKTQDGVVVKDKNGKEVIATQYDFTKADKFRFGKYTAHLLMVYDNGERDVPIQATVSFWVIPWKIVGIGLIVLIFALLGIKNTFFSYGNKIIKRSSKK